MAKSHVVKLGFIASRKLISIGISTRRIRVYLSSKRNLYGRILLILANYLVEYTKTFDKVYILASLVNKEAYLNGTFNGLIGNVSRKEIDIGVGPFYNDELRAEFVDFSYPFELLSATFMRCLSTNQKFLEF